MKDSTACASVQPAMSDYLEGALGPGRGAQVRWHLGHCARCRRDLEALRRLLHLLASIPADAPPEGLRERVLKAASELGTPLAVR